MNKDDERVTKGAVKEALKKAHRFYPLNYTTVKSIIDKLPVDTAKKAQLQGKDWDTATG